MEQIITKLIPNFYSFLTENIYIKNKKLIFIFNSDYKEENNTELIDMKIMNNIEDVKEVLNNNIKQIFIEYHNNIIEAYINNEYIKDFYIHKTFDDDYYFRLDIFMKKDSFDLSLKTTEKYPYSYNGNVYIKTV